MSSEYDIIFAGGGTCACVTAGRLAAADPELRILLIEAGKNTKGLQDHVQPARYPSHLAPHSTTVTFHESRPSEALGGRTAIVPIGHCVGGGSSVNFTMYTRAAASDYDDWENVYGNSGWGSDQLIPFARKLETYQPEPSAPTHGANGPLKISYGTTFTNVGQQFIGVAKEYDSSRGFTDDVNDFSTVNRYGRWPKYIDGQTGTRSDPAHHYIYNNTESKNLFVLEEARVKRVLFEDGRAVGVEWVKENLVGVPFAADEETHTVKAKKLVVLSAGALGSPAILERSGIGSKEILEKHDIHCQVDLPGVGNNYLDHNLVFNPMYAGEEAETLDTIFYGQPCEELDALIAQWRKDGTTLLAHNSIDAGIKIRPDQNDLKLLGPDFEDRWNTFFSPAPDKPVMWIGPLAALVGVPPPADIGVQKFFTMTYYTEYPVATGYAHITSGQDAHAPLDFHPGFLDQPADLAVLRWAYKKAREMARRMPCFRGEYPPGNPSFSPSSQAKLVRRDAAYAIDEPDIVYSIEDDAAIDDYLRKYTQTTWHSLGTCAMKPREQNGVVDASLNVYGVKGLKIADGSICPGNVSANTNNTVLIIGEKAATIIAEELGVNLRV